MSVADYSSFLAGGGGGGGSTGGLVAGTALLVLGVLRGAALGGYSLLMGIPFGRRIAVVRPIVADSNDYQID